LNKKGSKYDLYCVNNLEKLVAKLNEKKHYKIEGHTYDTKDKIFLRGFD
jgi:hypothetical protein